MDHLYRVDFLAGAVLAPDPESGVEYRHDIGRPFGCLAPREQGLLIGLVPIARWTTEIVMRLKTGRRS